jgi:threonine dehydrogenase-like Zn-dependent dehydrogenase
VQPLTGPVLENAGSHRVRAAVIRSGRIALERIQLPPLASTQILARPLATGICGSDHLALSDPAGFRQVVKNSDLPIANCHSDRGFVPGHELCAEVVEVGPDVTEWSPGDLLVASPVVDGPSEVRDYLGFSIQAPGGLAEMVLLDGSGHVPVPDDLSPLVAALAEPVTTGSAAVTRSRVQPPAGAVVTGCGAAGLGVVMALSAIGVDPIVVADTSAVRRRIAIRMGAHSAVDLRTGRDPISDWLTLAADGQELFLYECSGSVDSLPALLNSDLDFYLHSGSRWTDRGGRPRSASAKQRGNADRILRRAWITQEPEGRRRADTRPAPAGRCHCHDFDHRNDRPGRYPRRVRSSHAREHRS